MGDVLTVTVEDYDAVLPNDKIGTAQIKIMDIVNAPNSTIRKGKFNVIGSQRGVLYLDLMYFEEKIKEYGQLNMTLLRATGIKNIAGDVKVESWIKKDSVH